jgi:hypothetical protein
VSPGCREKAIKITVKLVPYVVEIKKESIQLLRKKIECNPKLKAALDKIQPEKQEAALINIYERLVLKELQKNNPNKYFKQE